MCGRGELHPLISGGGLELGFEEGDGSRDSRRRVCAAL